VEVSRLGAAAWIAWARGRHDEALSLMRNAAAIEDRAKASRDSRTDRSARELLGDMLLELKRPAEALKEFETSQTREPDRFRGLYGAAQAAAQSGDIAKARRYLRGWWTWLATGTPARSWWQRAISSPRTDRSAAAQALEAGGRVARSLSSIR